MPIEGTFTIGIYGSRSMFLEPQEQLPGVPIARRRRRGGRRARTIRFFERMKPRSSTSTPETTVISTIDFRLMAPVSPGRGGGDIWTPPIKLHWRSSMHNIVRGV